MPEKKGLPPVLWIVAGVVVISLVVVVLVLAMRSPTVEVVENVEPAVEKVVGPTPQELELAAQKKKQQEVEELDSLLKSGQDFMQSKDWDKASEKFEEALKRDPLNDRARTALNRVKEWASDKARLEEARKLHDGLKRGEAARLLREVVDSSVYYVEAQEELRKLIGAKTTLELTLENQVRQKDCTAAIATLQEILLIDPKDVAASTRLEDLKSAVGTKRCVK
jgi:tetratricopeptide (TPR) repeat protein